MEPPTWCESHFAPILSFLTRFHSSLFAPNQVADFTEYCLDSTWYNFLPVGIIFTLLYPIGVPATLFQRLFKYALRSVPFSGLEFIVVCCLLFVVDCEQAIAFPNYEVQ